MDTRFETEDRFNDLSKQFDNIDGMMQREHKKRDVQYQGQIRQ